jgi:hypothetical protein
MDIFGTIIHGFELLLFIKYQGLYGHPVFFCGGRYDLNSSYYNKLGTGMKSQAT